MNSKKRPQNQKKQHGAHPTVASASSSRKALDQSQARLLFIMAIFAICYVAIAVRLVDVSVFRGEWQGAASVPSSNKDESTQAILEDDGTGQEVTDSELAARPKRGNIVDRNGMMLASAIETQSLYADAKVMGNTDIKLALEQLKQIFPELNAEKLMQRMQKGGRFLYIKRHLTPEQQQAVMNLGIPGLALQADERRVYTQGNLFAHVLGYVDIDNHGIAGAEKYFDKYLRESKDAAKPLELSLDVRLQHIMHDELSAAVKEFNALGGAGLIVDSHTGEVLSMVSLPDFNPHFPARLNEESRFNRVSLGTYEMGSTFKTFSTAMALHYKTVGLEGGYDTTQPIRIGRFTIDDAHPERRWLSVPEIFAYSSNIGTVHMALDVGVERHKAFLKSLGLMSPMEIELPERGLPMYPKDWKEVNTMTISFGHGMSVTPLHLARALASIVDNGHFKQLTIKKNGRMNASKGAEVVRPEVTEDMRHLLRLVVEYGTASKANAAGYHVGGKTGTAEKVKSGGYAGNDKIVSFMGVFPAEKPRYIVYAMVDEPRGNKSTYGFATGGWIAAPVVGKVVARMGPLLAIKPDFSTGNAAQDPQWLQHARERLERAKSH